MLTLHEVVYGKCPRRYLLSPAPNCLGDSGRRYGRTAARLSFALWGGRFNPIVVVDRQEESESLVDAFRVDLILPIGDSDEVKVFVKRFPYLIKPFHHDSVFIGDGDGGARSQVLDVHNALGDTSSPDDEVGAWIWSTHEPRGAARVSRPLNRCARFFFVQEFV
jgi:hypothetical protein